MPPGKQIDIVFDGPPGRESGRFVEVEVAGASVGLGDWHKQENGTWHLSFNELDVARVLGIEGAAEVVLLPGGAGVILDELGAKALMSRPTHGGPHEPAVLLELGGRINKTGKRYHPQQFLMSPGQAAELVAEIAGAATNFDEPVAREFIIQFDAALDRLQGDRT